MDSTGEDERKHGAAEYVNEIKHPSYDTKTCEHKWLDVFHHSDLLYSKAQQQCCQAAAANQVKVEGVYTYYSSRFTMSEQADNLVLLVRRLQEGLALVYNTISRIGCVISRFQHIDECIRTFIFILRLREK